MTPEQLTGQVETHLIKTLVGNKHFLVHPQVEEDLQALVNAALVAGFKLEIASGFRGFARQEAIWNNKFSGKRVIVDSDSQPLDANSLTDEEKLFAILRWSALPGASRHHWGCDFDVYSRSDVPGGVSLQLEPWEYLSGHQSEFYRWLTDNLESFGFYFPYSEELGGVAIEPWHISHRSVSEMCLSELSVQLLSTQLARSSILGQDVIMKNLSNIYERFVTNISN